jgi:hypothetical protein
MIRSMTATLVLSALSMGALGCQFIARGPDDYRNDTRQLLESNSSSLKGCYDGVISSDKNATGTVTVSFTVEKETGRIKEVQIDESNSSAPPPVRECVVNSITGLELDPPDARDGQATFTYEFEIASQAAARVSGYFHAG